MNIIFMGTPEFACPALTGLIESPDHQVVAVFSQSPKTQGRGLKLLKSPVHTLADSGGIPVYTPVTLKNEAADELIKSIAADVIVVAAYGFIIPENILKAKKYGCLNIHPSKLPRYRGAAPLQRAIIAGDKETGVCIMQMDEGLDTGDILMEQLVTIGEKTTFMQLHDECAAIGTRLLLEVLDNIDTIKAVPQKEEGVVYAPKLSKEESKIDWNQSAFAIDCKVRGMNPWPGVYFEHQGKKVKIIEAQSLKINHSYIPGHMLNNKGNFLDIACRDGLLRLLKVQPEGKKIMTAGDYKNGIKI